MPVSAKEAGEELMAKVSRLNGRRLPPIPAAIKKLGRETQVYIYNVGPWSWTRHLGGAGAFIVPACLEGKTHSEPLVIDGMFQLPIPVDDQNFEWRMEEGGGLHVAEDVVGIGMMAPRSAAFIKYGVFIAEGKVPTVAELQAARQALSEYLTYLVSEANQTFARNPTEFYNYCGDMHRQAAKMLKKTAAECPWLSTTVTTPRQTCGSCGTDCNLSAFVCPTCKFILDNARYEKHKGSFAN